MLVTHERLQTAPMRLSGRSWTVCFRGWPGLMASRELPTRSGHQMNFASIDPGAVHAAIALFHDGHPVFVDDIRATNGILDSIALAKALADMKVRHVVVENV